MSSMEFKTFKGEPFTKILLKDQHTIFIDPKSGEMKQGTTDTTVICSDGKIGIHRVLLLACSEYAGRLITDDKEHAHIVLTDFDMKTVTRFFNLLYTGSCIIDGLLDQTALYQLSDLFGIEQSRISLKQEKASQESVVEMSLPTSNGTHPNGNLVQKDDAQDKSDPTMDSTRRSTSKLPSNLLQSPEAKVVPMGGPIKPIAHGRNLKSNAAAAGGGVGSPQSRPSYKIPEINKVQPNLIPPKTTRKTGSGNVGTPNNKRSAAQAHVSLVVTFPDPKKSKTDQAAQRSQPKH